MDTRWVNARENLGRGLEQADRKAIFVAERRVSVHSLSGGLNVVVGWTGLFLGLAVALWMGTWAFDGPLPSPAGFESYDALPRRLLRLGHIAAIAVGALNILFGRELPRLALSAFWKRTASILAALAWPGLALGCMAAAFVPSLKYALPPGALALTTASAIAMVGAWRQARRGTTEDVTRSGPARD